MEWQPIETAVASDKIHEPPRVLVFGECGIQMGHIYVYPDGHLITRAEGFHGDWKISHWMPLPEPPKEHP